MGRICQQSHGGEGTYTRTVGGFEDWPLHCTGGGRRLVTYYGMLWTGLADVMDLWRALHLIQTAMSPLLRYYES